MGITAWICLKTSSSVQRFWILGGELRNRCKDFPETTLQRAVILDFRLRLENHYKVFLGISPNAAVILDFRG